MPYEARARRVVAVPEIAQPSAWVTWATEWTISPAGAPSAGPGAKTEVEPAPRAAANRCGIPGAGRREPLSETSPTNAAPAGGIDPVAAEASAAATARSDAGSSTLIPPEEAPKRSARPSGSPVVRSSTAATSWNRRGSRPVTCRLPAPSAEPTRAWTSTASARRPAWMTATADPGQAVRTHLEPGRLTLGAEAVLAAAEHPETRAGIALERQDDVHGMLEGPGASQIAVLRHVARQEHSDALGLRQADERVGAQTDLGHAPRHGRTLRVAEGLDGVHRQHRRARGASGVEHDVEVAPRREPDVVNRDAEPPRPRRHLGTRLLPGDQKTGCAGGDERAKQMEHEGGLPDPRRARKHDDRPGDQTAAEYPVESRHPGPDPRLVLPGVKRHRPDDVPSRAGD